MYGRFKFNESDIAIETNMFVVLQLIHCCQLVNMEEFAEYNKDNLVDKIRDRNELRQSRKSKTPSKIKKKNTLQPSMHPRNYEEINTRSDRGFSGSSEH